MENGHFAGQKGQAVIEYVFVLAFVMVMLVTFVRTYSSAISRSVQTLNFALTQSLSSGVCTNFCFLNPGEFQNPVEP
jgi:Flp pilus assembly pilin Flp